MEEDVTRRATVSLGPLLLALQFLAATASAQHQQVTDGSTQGPAGSEGAVAPEDFQLPERPRPLIEWGEDFNKPGRFSHGFRVPGGGVWRPQLLLFGNFRTALQSVESGGSNVSEWVNRLELALNLRLTGTERLLLTLRPLDDNVEFCGYEFGSDGEGFDWDECATGKIRTLFFEGELGEMFPGWDDKDRRALDLGLAIGRQPISFQQGWLIDDILDAAGFTKTALRPKGSSNFRVTGLFAWNELHRAARSYGRDRKDDGAKLLGVFTSTDLHVSTLDIDLAWVSSGDAEGAGLVAGLSATQRLGRFGTTFRILSSVPTGASPSALADRSFRRGTLLFSELTWAPRRNHDAFYLNTFVSHDYYTPAARDPEKGGVLAQAGILFDAPGIGKLGSALSSDPEDVAGFAFGIQAFRKLWRQQLVVELAARTDLDGTDTAEAGLGLRFQQALGRRTLLQLDVFHAVREHRSSITGARVEFLVKF